MKIIQFFLLCICISSCKTNYVSIVGTLPGDYSEGKDGWQLRLYQDSTFFMQKNIYFEIYPDFHGRWAVIRSNPLSLRLSLEGTDTSLLARCCTQRGLMSTFEWTVDILNENLVQIKRNDTADGNILKRATIRAFKDDEKIYSISHESR